MTESAALSDKFFERLENNFLEYADKVAISYNGDERQITYKELNEISARVHGYLKANGLKPDDFVMIALPRGAEAGAVAIGVLRAGIAYTIVEEGYPRERIDFIYKDCGCKLCVDSAAYKEILNAEPVYGFEKADDHKAAFAIYTSGTTGTPKGVLLERSVLIESVRDFSFDGNSLFEADDRFAYSSPLSFSAFEIYLIPCVYAGSTFIITSSGILKNINRFTEFLTQSSISCFFLPPSLFKLFDNFPHTVKKLFSGGEAARNLYYNNIVVYNTYGQSETARFVGTFEICKPYELTPVCNIHNKNSQLVILTEEGCEAKSGDLGEICLNNECFRGYINRPEETSRAFRGGIYHTGDLGRMLEDGSIVIAGRADDMVKINGNRVEPAEIEEVVKNAFGLNWAAAKVIDKNGHKSVCVYYIDEPKTDLEEAKKVIASKLPAYMIPANYMQIVKMPLNANGKFSRRLLPDPQEQTADLKKPQTELEQKLFYIVAENINTVSFGTDTNLVSLGFDSIAVMKLCKDITEKLGKEISFADVMKQPDITGIASVLESGGKTAVQTYPVQKYYPLTESQRGVYINWELDRETTQYNIPFYYSFRNCDAQKLAEAVRKAVNNHCHLKARLEMVDGEPMQRRCDADEVVINQYDLKDLPDKEFFQKLVKPFDLLNSPMYRISVYKYGSSVYLFMDYHHVIYDGMSSRVLINDIIKAYNNVELPSEKLTAYDFALYREEFEKSEDYKSAEKYFDGILGDAEPARFTAYSNADGKKVSKVMSRISASEIIDYCHKSGVTVSSFMHAAFAEALHRITREDEFLYTTVSNGRSADNALQNCTGMFVQTLPVVFNSHQLSATSQQPREESQKSEVGSQKSEVESAQTHAEQRVSDYIQTMHQQLQNTFANECYPYTEFSERHKINAEIMFIYQGGVLGENTNLLDNSVESIELEKDTPVFPISILVYPENNDFTICAEYDGMKYCSRDIQTMIEVVANTAISMTSAERIKDVSLVSKEQKTAIIAASAGEKLEYDKTQTWIDLFKKQVEAHPDSLAVADSVSSMTYVELDSQSDKIAAWLISSGVKEDEFVAVKMNRVKEFITAITGIQKAGAAYVPIAMDYPEERIAYMLEDSEARIVITEQTVSEILSGDFKLENGYRAAPERAAYMIYTSGSTGKPKGARLHQRGLLNFTYSLIHKYEMTAEDRISSYRAFSFDAMIADIYPTLCVGASMHIMPEEIRKDLNQIYDFLIKNRITGGGYTTSIASLLIKNYDLKQRFIACGGEALKNVSSDNVVIYNAYGPTECTDDITIFRIEKGEHYESVPIGRPVFNSYCFIVDKYNNLMPEGMPGELCYAGPQTGYGYWHLDEKTREVFSDCPFVDGLRMYHTGDLARYDKDSQIQYIGRIDFQVKLRGFRIELGEIDSVASGFTGMKHVISQVKKVGGTENLILYYSASEQIDKDALKAFLSKRLTDYMVPSVFMQLDEMPLTPNGKIDRKSLPEPELEVAEIVAPADETEQKLFDIASEMLKTDKFGVTTSLISMGMSSLMAMRFAAAVQKQMNVKVSVADIMKHQTIRLVAENINGESTVTTIKAYPKRELYPLTENQRGVYIDWEMHRDTTQYNIPFVLKFSDRTADCLEKAIRTAFAAHSYLKTRFVQTDEDVMQKPFEEETEILVQKLDKEPDSDFFQGRVRPFDLFNDRLYRVEIYSAPKAVYLFMDIHHIIYDGLSGAALRNDIMAACDEKPVESEKITAYDFALYEKEILASEAFAKAEARFDALVSDATAVNYPSSTKADSKASGTVSAYVAADIVDKFCKKNSVTANSFMQAAFAETLHRITREENPLYVTISNGRLDGATLERSMGMFVKTLPVVLDSRQLSATGSQPREGEFEAESIENARIDKKQVLGRQPLADSRQQSINSAQTHAEQSVSDYVRSIHEQLQESYASDFYPYTRIVERHGIHADIMFAYQGGLYEGGDVNEKGFERVELKLDTVKFPVDVTVYPDNGRYMIIVEYDGMKYSCHDMQTLAEAVANAAMSMTSAERIKDVSLVSEEQKASLKVLSEGEKLDYDKSRTWVDLFKTQVSENAEHIAVVDAKSSITYAELDAQSDTVAAYLAGKGVKAEEFIAVKMSRCKEFIVTALALHKLGAGYVPIDDDAPEDRIRFMLEDSESRFMLDDAEIQKALKSGLKLTTGNAATPESIAYMIYTSGSTGKPKGVAIQHSAMLNFMHFIRSRWGLNSESRITCHSNFAFDAAVEDLYPVLTAGGTLFIIPEDIRMDMTLIRQFLKDNRITGGCYTTQLGQMLGADYELDVDYICLGGEKMVAVPQTAGHVYNTYGPTEFTVDATYFELNKNITYDNIPIGRPLHNCAGYVVDNCGQLVPQGIMGELCLAGPQMAKEYWKRPELTAKNFEVLRSVGRKVYHTGDLVRYNDEGQLEYLGRIDFQVKLRGFRIELGEVDSRAAQFEGISHVIAQVKKVGSTDNLVLYYDGEHQINKDALKAFMAETLPDFMVPTVFMQLDKMPLNANGKIDRKALPLPAVESKGSKLPETELEKKLCAIFAEVLGMETVYADEDFFEIGGSSISAMKLTAKCMNNGIKVVYSNIFDNATPEKLAKFVENNVNSKPEKSIQSEVKAKTLTVEPFYSVLKYNTPENVNEISYTKLDKVFVTGANGFLGIHVVKELIDNGCSKVYCLLRGKDYASVVNRLKMMLMYYFDDSLDELFNSRIIVVNGDITDEGLYEKLAPLDFEALINCAACVKHFVNDDILDRVNFHGVENLVNICQKLDRKLIQISTVSIAGYNVNNALPENTVLHENMLEIGQVLDHKYGYTKFLAEKAVLSGVKNGLRAKIIRVGNLMGRISDGEFQSNFVTNNFINTIRAYKVIGAFPVSAMDSDVEFSPIDSVAKAVVKLAGTPDKFTVFHAYNCYSVHMAKVIECMNKRGFSIEIVDDEEFGKRFQAVLQDESKVVSVNSLIAYADNNVSRTFIEPDNRYTIKALYRLCYSWPIIDERYLLKAIEAIATLGYFD